MSDVDSVSNVGLSPALPIAEKPHPRQGTSSHDAKDDPPGRQPEAKADEPATDAAGTHRIPKSLIDEYA
jgi:hypothetical protein